MLLTILAENCIFRLIRIIFTVVAVTVMVILSIIKNNRNVLDFFLRENFNKLMKLRGKIDLNKKKTFKLIVIRTFYNYIYKLNFGFHV